MTPAKAEKLKIELMRVILKSCGGDKNLQRAFTADQTTAIIDVLSTLLAATVTSVESCDCRIMAALETLFESRIRGIRERAGIQTCLDTDHTTETVH